MAIYQSESAACGNDDQTWGKPAERYFLLKTKFPVALRLGMRF
jgi:hypothetical protein